MSSKDASLSVQNKKMQSSPNSQGFQVNTVRMVLSDDWLQSRVCIWRAEWIPDREAEVEKGLQDSRAPPQHERVSSHLNARFDEQQDLNSQGKRILLERKDSLGEAFEDLKDLMIALSLQYFSNALFFRSV